MTAGGSRSASECVGRALLLRAVRTGSGAAGRRVGAMNVSLCVPLLPVSSA